MEAVCRMGLKPREVLRSVERKHIFTHITWEMEGFELACGREDPRFVWATPEQLENDHPMPTAFRQFWER